MPIKRKKIEARKANKEERREPENQRTVTRKPLD